MPHTSMLRQITDFANRANPYPVYEELRRTPVLPGGGRPLHHQLVLRHQGPPARSADQLRRQEPGRRRGGRAGPGGGRRAGCRRRSCAWTRPSTTGCGASPTAPSGPPHRPRRIDGLRGRHAGDRHRADRRVRGRAADRPGRPVRPTPSPVTVICRLLGVPREDEPRFRAWVDPLVASLDPATREGAEADARETAQEARMQLGMYLAGLVERQHQGAAGRPVVRPGEQPGPGRLHDDDGGARLGAAADRRPRDDGQPDHQRHAHAAAAPGILRRLREDPGLAVNIVEELLRYEAPVQLVPQHTCIADIEVRGVTIPRARGSGWSSPRATGTRSGSRSPSSSTRTGGHPAPRLRQRHPQLLRRSRWPGWRPRSRCPRWPGGWTTPAWSRTRRRTGRTPCCADPGIWTSPSTGCAEHAVSTLRRPGGQNGS